MDERDIRQVHFVDLLGYTQHHFFAGIGGWPLALLQAGWPGDRAVVTGSPPCQPFSTAGAMKGFDDDRHLWPELARLIGQLRPPAIFGEQVASPLGRRWWATVQADLEDMGYGAAAFDLCAAGVGAPHIRQRLYWVGHALQSGLERHAGHGNQPAGPPSELAGSAAQASGAGRVANASSLRCDERGQAQSTQVQGERTERGREDAQPKQAGELSRGLERLGGDGPGTFGFWANPQWLACRDGRWLPVEPGLAPMVDGLSEGMAGRVSAIKGFGNAVVVPLAARFIKAYMEIDL